MSGYSMETIVFADTALSRVCAEAATMPRRLRHNRTGSISWQGLNCTTTLVWHNHIGRRVVTIEMQLGDQSLENLEAVLINGREHPSRFNHRNTLVYHGRHARDITHDFSNLRAHVVTDTAA